MLRRFLKQTLSSKSSLGSSLSGSALNSSKSYKSVFQYKSISGAQSYNFSYLSLTQNTFLQENTITSDQIKSFRDKVSTAGIDESLEILSQAVFSHSPNHNADLLEIYKAIEGKWTHSAHTYGKASTVIHLSNFFSNYGLGGKKFWDTLVDRFAVLVESNVYSLHDIALFVYNSSRFKEPTEQFWELVEKKLVEQGPVGISGDTVSMLASAYLQYHSTAFGPSHRNFNSTEQQKDSNIEEKSIWVVLKGLVIKKVYNLSGPALSSVAQTFSGIITEDGFWLDVEDRFNELAHRLSAREISQIVASFGQAKRGTANFWTDVEKYAVGSIKHLEEDEAANFIAGFAKHDQGTIKFWDAFQSHAIQNLNKYTADSLSLAVSGFAQAEINKPRLWDALQERSVDLISKFNSTGLINLIKGFSTAKRGDEGFWGAVEEKLLHSDEDEFIVRFLIFNELKNANKVTPKLASFFKDVTEFANFYAQQQEAWNEGKEGKQKDEKTQVRSL